MADAALRAHAALACQLLRNGARRACPPAIRRGRQVNCRLRRSARETRNAARIYVGRRRRIVRRRHSRAQVDSKQASFGNCTPLVYKQIYFARLYFIAARRRQLRSEFASRATRGQVSGAGMSSGGACITRRALVIVVYGHGARVAWTRAPLASRPLRPARTRWPANSAFVCAQALSCRRMSLATAVRKRAAGEC